jgi:hypothetical protein
MEGHGGFWDVSLIPSPACGGGLGRG